MKSGTEQIRSQLLDGIEAANVGGRRRGAPLALAAAMVLLVVVGALAWFGRDDSNPTDVVANDPQPTTQPEVAPTEQPTAPAQPTPPPTSPAGGPALILDANGAVIANLATKSALDPDTVALLWEVQRATEEILGPDLDNQLFSTAGLTIETTIDVAAQQQMLEARSSVRDEYDVPRQYAISGLAVEPSTGAIRAVLPLHRGDDVPTLTVQQNVRQPGSLFQPIALAHALEVGYVPDDEVDGRGPCSFAGEGEGGTTFEVENFGNSPGRITSISDQTLSSNNCWPVRLGLESGNDRMLLTGQRLGLTSPHFPVAAMPLGVWEVSPTEMTTVYNTFANGGSRVRPYLIERVLGSDGAVLFDANAEGDRAFAEAVDAQVACLVTEVLVDNVRIGTGAAVAAAMGPQPTAGKTGTIENFEDAWFAGYTPYLTTTIWMGDPEQRAKITVAGMEVTGGRFPAEVFGRFNAAFHRDLPVAEFPTCAATTGSDTFKPE